MNVREEQLLRRRAPRRAERRRSRRSRRGAWSGSPASSTPACRRTRAPNRAPMPSVSSLMRATPSSPRSVTMSVAPNSRASFCRASWRLIAMMRSAPICFAESTPSRPTAPSPTTATVAPGLHVGRVGREPAGAQHVGSRQQARDQIGGRDARASRPACRRRAARAGTAPARRRTSCACMHTRSDTRPCRCGQVLSDAKNEPIDELAGLDATSPRGRPPRRCRSTRGPSASGWSVVWMPR